MKRLLLLSSISLLIFSCSDFDSDLPLSTNSGIAFVASRDTVIHEKPSLPQDERELDYDECLNPSWSLEEIENP